MRLSKSKKVVVVGAGVGGLATAVRLSIKGILLKFLNLIHT